MKMKLAECSERSAHKIQMSRNHPKKNTKYIVFRETLKLLLSLIYILRVWA